MFAETFIPAVVADAEFEAGRADAKAGRAPIIDLAEMPDDLGAIAYHAGYDTGAAEVGARPALTVLPGGAA